jgi:predicted P-loop ATPase
MTKSKQSKRQIIQEWLSENYHLKYNEIRKKVELTRANEGDFAEMDDFTLNTMISEMDRVLFFTPTVQQVYSIIMSDFIEKTNPIKDYFKELKYDYGFDKANLEITHFSNCVTLKSKREKMAWEETLKRWMVASVANLFNREGCQNHHCIVLTGDQGAFKTTYLNLLAPEKLKKYCYTGKVKLDEKDTNLKLGANFIINLDDQLKKLFRKDAETMKTLITQGDFYERLPYDKFPTYIQRIANFIGSINGTDFLNDTTGNRRFLPFEVEAIDIEKAQAIDMNKCWFEAYTLYQEGFQYWFTKEELNLFFGEFESYTVISPEEELFYKYFEPLTNEADRTPWFKRMRVTDILLKLKEHTMNRIDINGKQLGDILKNKVRAVQCSFRHEGKASSGYWVREKDQEEREKAAFEEEVQEVAF